jgi:hypothetical protein
MRSWKRSLALAFSTGVIFAVPVMLFVTRDPSTQDLLDAIVLLAVVAALIGLYLLRHYARAHLLYSRHTATSDAHAPDTAPDVTRDATTPFTELSRRVWW